MDFKIEEKRTIDNVKALKWCISNGLFAKGTPEEFAGAITSVITTHGALTTGAMAELTEFILDRSHLEDDLTQNRYELIFAQTMAELINRCCKIELQFKDLDQVEFEN